MALVFIVLLRWLFSSVWVAFVLRQGLGEDTQSADGEEMGGGIPCPGFDMCILNYSQQLLQSEYRDQVLPNNKPLKTVAYNNSHHLFCSQIWGLSGLGEAAPMGGFSFIVVIRGHLDRGHLKGILNIHV